MSSQPGYNDLCNNFIHSVVETNRPIVPQGFKSLNLWNKGNEGSVKVIRDFLL